MSCLTILQNVHCVMQTEKYLGWFSALGLFSLVLFMLQLRLGFGLIVCLVLFTVCRAVWKRLPTSWPPGTRNGVTIVFLLLGLAALGWGGAQGMRYGVKTLSGQTDQMLAYALVALNDIRTYVPKVVGKHLPQDVAQINVLMEQAGALFGKNALGFGATSMHLLFQFLFALLIAATCCTRPDFDTSSYKPFRREWLNRIHEYSECFAQLMTAQMYVALWNAFCTGIFLYAILPIMGVELSFREALIVFTLFISLIPALGNIVANSVMAFLCLPHGAAIVLLAVVFLFLIHKAEYIINARIIGKNVKATVPEMLMAILIGECLFGLPGLILGPVSYAYLKMYLIKQELV